VDTDVEWIAAIQAAWTDADQTLWADVLNFWFFDRVFERVKVSTVAMPQAAIVLAKRFEGFHSVPKNDPDRAHPYIYPAGFWTIGYGHLCDKLHPPITETEVEAYLAADLQTALATESEGRLAAIVNFIFNLGGGRLQTSTLRHRVNQQDWAATARELRRWI
jgi:lysozyme